MASITSRKLAGESLAPLSVLGVDASGNAPPALGIAASTASCAACGVQLAPIDGGTPFSPAAIAAALFRDPSAPAPFLRESAAWTRCFGVPGASTRRPVQPARPLPSGLGESSVRDSVVVATASADFANATAALQSVVDLTTLGEDAVAALGAALPGVYAVLASEWCVPVDPLTDAARSALASSVEAAGGVAAPAAAAAVADELRRVVSAVAPAAFVDEVIATLLLRADAAEKLNKGGAVATALLTGDPLRVLPKVRDALVDIRARAAADDGEGSVAEEACRLRTLFADASAAAAAAASSDALSSADPPSALLPSQTRIASASGFVEPATTSSTLDAIVRRSAPLAAWALLLPEADAAANAGSPASTASAAAAAMADEGPESWAGYHPGTAFGPLGYGGVLVTADDDGCSDMTGEAFEDALAAAEASAAAMMSAAAFEEGSSDGGSSDASDDDAGGDASFAPTSIFSRGGRGGRGGYRGGRGGRGGYGGGVKSTKPAKCGKAPAPKKQSRAAKQAARAALALRAERESSLSAQFLTATLARQDIVAVGRAFDLLALALEAAAVVLAGPHRRAVAAASPPPLEALLLIDAVLLGGPTALYGSLSGAAPSPKPKLTQPGASPLAHYSAQLTTPFVTLFTDDPIAALTGSPGSSASAFVYPMLAAGDAGNSPSQMMGISPFGGLHPAMASSAGSSGAALAASFGFGAGQILGLSAAHPTAQACQPKPLNALAPDFVASLRASMEAAASETAETLSSMATAYASSGVALPTPESASASVERSAVASRAAATDDPLLNMDCVLFAALLLGPRQAGLARLLLRALSRTVEAVNGAADETDAAALCLPLGAALRAGVVLLRGTGQLPPTMLSLAQAVQDPRLKSLLEWACDSSLGKQQVMAQYGIAAQATGLRRAMSMVSPVGACLAFLPSSPPPSLPLHRLSLQSQSRCCAQRLRQTMGPATVRESGGTGPRALHVARWPPSTTQRC